jgi:hypothetical protein
VILLFEHDYRGGFLKKPKVERFPMMTRVIFGYWSVAFFREAGINDLLTMLSERVYDEGYADGRKSVVNAEKELLIKSLAALKDAKEEIEFWGNYADSSFQEKHKLHESVNQFNQLIAEIEKSIKWPV